MYLAKKRSSFGVGVAAQIADAMTDSVLIVATISTKLIGYSPIAFAAWAAAKAAITSSVCTAAQIAITLGSSPVVSQSGSQTCL
jgi:hypothetical protein